MRKPKSPPATGDSANGREAVNSLHAAIEVASAEPRLALLTLIEHLNLLRHGAAILCDLSEGSR